MNDRIRRAGEKNKQRRFCIFLLRGPRITNESGNEYFNSEDAKASHK